VLNNVQVTTGPCTDRAVFTFTGPGLPGYEAKYVQATLTCGSGEPVTTAGAAQITLRFEQAVAHDANGNATVSPLSFAPTAIDQELIDLRLRGRHVWVIGAGRYYCSDTAQAPSRIIFESIASASLLSVGSLTRREAWIIAASATSPSGDRRTEEAPLVSSAPGC
jgi:hypothetical protein